MSSIGASKQLYSEAPEHPVLERRLEHDGLPQRLVDDQGLTTTRSTSRRSRPRTTRSSIPSTRGRSSYENSPENDRGLRRPRNRRQGALPPDAGAARALEGMAEEVEAEHPQARRPEQRDINALKDESAWIVLGNLGVDLRVKDAGGPLMKVAYPKEGLIGWFDGEQMVKKSKHKDVFATFIELASRRRRTGSRRTSSRTAGRCSTRRPTSCSSTRATRLGRTSSTTTTRS